MNGKQDESDGGSDRESDRQYRLYLNNVNQVTIVSSLYWFSNDWEENRFYQDSDPEQESTWPMTFKTKEEAKKYLNDHFKIDSIDPEYRNAKSLFAEHLKDDTDE